MTTQSWTQSYEHASDALFRAWGSALSAKLQSGGLIQTADTGQINWASVVRAGTNASAGYELYYLNDSLHGTSPIYIRIGYGTGGLSFIPRLSLQIGTGTNGSGALSGTVSSERGFHQWGNANVNSNLKNNWSAYGEGYFSGLLSVDAQALQCQFALCRTSDSSGTPTGDGFAVIYSGSNESGVMCVRAIATATAFSTSLNGGVVPGGVTSSFVGADPQIYMAYGILPRVYPLFSVCGFVQSEINVAGTTFSATTVGSTPRTFISPGSNSYNGKIFNGGSPAYGTAMLYE